MDKEKKEITTFVDKVEVIKILYKGGNYICNFPTKKNTLKVSFKKNIKYNTSSDNELLLAQVQIKLIIQDKDKVVAELNSAWIVAYDSSGYTKNITKKLLSNFESTALFQALPYIREDFHKMSLNMGLDPIVLPLFKPPKSARNKKISKK